jgi:Uma2 family endonuclease
MVVKNITTPGYFAELYDQLGRVPMTRIRMDAPPGMATEEDVIRILESDENRICELVDGTLVEKAVGNRESGLAAKIIIHLGAFLGLESEDVILGADGGIRVLKGNVRFPDVSYFPIQSLPNGEEETGKIWSTFPALAVEVLSDSNTSWEIDRKIHEYFKGGTKLVWIVEPELKAIDVYMSPSKYKHLTIRDTLKGGTVLPGFSLPLSKLFPPRTKKKGRSK